jgi:hypothetical protein
MSYLCCGPDHRYLSNRFLVKYHADPREGILKAIFIENEYLKRTYYYFLS